MLTDQHAPSRLCVLCVCKKWTLTPLYVPSCHAFAKDMLILCHWHCDPFYHHLDLYLYLNRLLIYLHWIVFLFTLQLAKLLTLENLLSKFVKLLLVLTNLLFLNALLNVLLMPSFRDLIASTNFFKFQCNKVPLQGSTKPNAPSSFSGVKQWWWCDSSLLPYFSNC